MKRSRLSRGSSAVKNDRMDKVKAGMLKQFVSGFLPSTGETMVKSGLSSKSLGKIDKSVRKLSGLAVFSRPNWIDWTVGYKSAWDVAFKQTDDDDASERWIPSEDFYFPLPDGFKVPSDIKERLGDLDVTLVKLKDRNQYGIALTKAPDAFVDWNISDAFVRLGYLPPTYSCFALTRHYGMEMTPAREKVVMACGRVIDLVTKQVTRERGELADIDSWLKKGGRF